MAPQTPHEWSENLEDAKGLIENIIATNNIDSKRIYSYGCSAGGYMALDMVVHKSKYVCGSSNQHVQRLINKILIHMEKVEE